MSGTTFGSNGSLQQYTVTLTGEYELTAYGAQGGPGEVGKGGYGTEITGDIHLTAGTVLELVVGGMGQSSYYGGGGGGGSFVFEQGSPPGAFLEVAGGGGGGGYPNRGAGGGGEQGATGGDGGHNDAGDPFFGTVGGMGGAHGAAGHGGPTGGGGGGGFTGGNGSTGGSVAGANGSTAETSFAGGRGYADGTGGYGGGGGAGRSGGGGGGGYGGGGGGSASGGGGGGGSYAGDLTNASSLADSNLGAGEVIIDYLGLCYLRGTRILTPTGEVAVEDLRIGDRLVTRFGGTQVIKWIGRQNFATDEAAEHPIHVRPGALGDHLPARDLYVSPGHSFLIEDRLVLARLLVNGVTVTQEAAPGAWIEYFNLDLGVHDCVIAEGAWAETYADAPGLRAQFHNAASYHARYPDQPPAEALILCAERPEKGVKLTEVLDTITARANPPDSKTPPLRLVS